MRAVIYTGIGGPEVIRIGDVPGPDLKPGYVRVRVRAAGLNRADILQRRGTYPAPPGSPAEIPGLEYAGEVEDAREVTRWQVGDRVMGLVGGGAMAEFVVAHQDEVLEIPPALSFAQAAAIPEAFLTAYDALVVRARLRAGERVLIHAVGSGVGTAAVQLAKQLGATVLGTSRSAAKLAQCKEYGLDVGIDISRESFRETIIDPVDVVLDVLGGPALADNLALLAPRGRVVLLGLLVGRRAEVDLAPMLSKRLALIGSTMRSRGLTERIELVQEFAERVLPLFEPSVGREASIRPVLERTYPIAELAEAQRAMEANETFGKAVVVWPDRPGDDIP